MKVNVLREVPGLTHGMQLRRGDTVELPDGLAASLINDGYVEAVRTAPAERAETADNPHKRRPGRPRREG